MKDLPKNYIFSDKFKELIKQRIDIQEEKLFCVKEQKYEQAAAVRDKEKELMKKIYSELGINVDEVNSRSYKDIVNIIELIKEGDIDFSNAIDRLEKKDLERMILVRYVERYIKGEITSETIHDAIKESFDVIEKETIRKIEKRLEEKIKILLWT